MQFFESDPRHARSSWLTKRRTLWGCLKSFNSVQFTSELFGIFNSEQLCGSRGASKWGKVKKITRETEHCLQYVRTYSLSYHAPLVNIATVPFFEWLISHYWDRIRENDLMCWFVLSAELPAGCSAAALLARRNNAYSDASVSDSVAKELVRGRSLLTYIARSPLSTCSVRQVHSLMVWGSDSWPEFHSHLKPLLIVYRAVRSESCSSSLVIKANALACELL